MSDQLTDIQTLPDPNDPNRADPIFVPNPGKQPAPRNTAPEGYSRFQFYQSRGDDGLPEGWTVLVDTDPPEETGFPAGAFAAFASATVANAYLDLITD